MHFFSFSFYTIFFISFFINEILKVKYLIFSFLFSYVSLRGTSDFFALNHYTSNLVETVPREEGQEWYNFSGVKQSIDPSWPGSASAWLKVSQYKRYLLTAYIELIDINFRERETITICIRFIRNSLIS